MRTVPAYPAARTAALKVQSHFERHLETARTRGADAVHVPDVSTIEAVIDAAFWASLRREEGYVPKISIALVSPAMTDHPLLFERPLPLHPNALTKIAPAVERAGIHLGVSREGEDLCVWGTLRTIPTYAFVLEVAAPGLLVIKHHRGDPSGKFVNVAVLEGESIKLVDESASTLPDCPPLLASLLGFDSPASWVGSVNVLVQIAVSMRAHGRGGLMLVVPAGSDAWRDSIVHPVAYSVRPPFTELAELMRTTEEAARSQRRWRDALARVVDAVAGVTAVDGATILTDAFELLAFGAKIARRRGSAPVEQAMVTEPVEDSTAVTMHPSELGGTRHLSAAQFVHDQRDSAAFVASQDGRFTVFAWSPCENMVHAHRVEALLL